MDAIPAEPLLPRRKAGMLLLAMLAMVAALTAGAMALPHNPYIRYQQFASGDFSRARWVYERIHFDPTPIDVAVLGSSRIEAAISTPKLEKALSATLGRPIHVAGLAVPLEGRDAHYAIAQELLRAHPETRIVLLSVVEPIRRSHPAFKNIADTSLALTSPAWLNYYWLENVAFLPYRNMSLFVQSLLPRWFGMDANFNAARYARFGTDFDTTHNFQLDNGAVVEREKGASHEKLDKAATARARPGPSRLAQLTGADDNIVEHLLSRRLTAQMAARCGETVFVHMPVYRENVGEVEAGFYGELGPLLMTPPDIGDVWSDYADANHLRRPGIDKVTAWLPGALTPFLEPLRTSGCPR